MLFYIAFLGQIYLISHYYPRRIARRMRYVLDTYPAGEYPKLYPKPAEYYRLGVWLYEQANRAIVAIGLLILAAVMFWIDHANFADDGYISEFWPMAYGVLQFLPGIALEFSGFSQIRLMRQANTTTVRKADLVPRKLFNFVSPMLLAAAVGAMVASVVYGLYLHDFDVSLGHDSFRLALVTIGTNGLITALGAWILYGRKPDPHQASKDRTRQITASLSSFAYISIAMSAFMMYNAADGVYDIDYLDAALMSIYFQVIVFLSLGHILRTQPLGSLNFDVYKAEEQAPATSEREAPAL